MELEVTPGSTMSTSTSKNPSTSSLISLNEQAVSPILASSSNTSWDLNADDFTKELSCSLCLELFKEPVILPCGHNFCKPCLEAIWNKKGVFCPECHINVPDRKFIINQALEKMAEKIKTCHVGGQQQKCMEHGEPLTLYWKPRGTLACFTCREAQMPKDQCTQFLLIPDAVQIYTERLLTLRLQLRSILEKTLIHQLKEESEILLQEMEGNLNKLQDRSQVAKDTLVCIQARMENKTENSSLGQLVMGSLNPGEFKGPMHYAIWKEMRTVLNPDITFITLDPNTAHPNLVLSEGLTCVWHNDTKQILPDLPERFDCSVSVLASEGFTTGKHYWEVEVKKKMKWTLGVVRESINRKGNYPLSPKEGHWLIKLRNKNELKAVDVRPKCLTLSGNLCRVGIYLDYEGGQVSFYEAMAMSHIYTFTDTFTEKVYPYFCPCLNDSGENKEPLRIIAFDM
ncbi:Tripartite motif-containing protein 69, partial [Ophiophagus hannah]